MTSVLVSGRNGQVGHAISELADDSRFDHLEITPTDRSTLDLTQPDSIIEAVEHFRPDVVINAAAYTAVDRAEDEAAVAMAANADGVRTLADQCVRRGARLLHISTDYVFDGTKDGWYDEQDPISPLGAYGRSKAEGEAAARACANHLVLRTAWVYGSHGNNFVKTMLRLGAERDELRVVADQVGCPSSAHDIAFALLQLADNDATGTFHLAGAEATSWHGFATAILELAGLDAAVTAITTPEYPTPAPRPANSRLNSDALAALTGVRLPGWTESLPEVVDTILNAESGD